MRGIDVSRWQGEIDWEEVGAASFADRKRGFPFRVNIVIPVA